jgi:hypothetical protein
MAGVFVFGLETHRRASHFDAVGKLIQCPACKREVSSAADSCPACGQPIRRGFLGRAGTERIFNIGCLTVILVIGTLLLLGSCGLFFR